MLYYNPKSLSEALELLTANKDKDLVVLAGGTDVVPKLNTRPERSGYFNGELTNLDDKVVVYLGDVDLNYIKDEGDKVVIGAMTTITEVLDSEVVDKVPVLKQALNQMAGITIRNIATLGGNIMNASPAADSVPALIALDAKAVFVGPAGERTADLYTIFVGPGKTDKQADEILKEIVIPVKAGKADFIKFGRRKAESLSVVNGAAYVEVKDGVIEDVIIALGAVAPTAVRLVELEAELKGKAATEEVIAEVAAKAVDYVKPITDKRGSSDYRKKLAKVLVRRALGAAIQ